MYAPPSFALIGARLRLPAEAMGGYPDTSPQTIAQSSFLNLDNMPSILDLLHLEEAITFCMHQSLHAAFLKPSNPVDLAF